MRNLYVNLFHADAVHKFAKKHWKAVSNEFQGPMFKAMFKKLSQVANKILKEKPINDYIEL